MDVGCPVDILIDLSEPAPAAGNDNTDTDKENTAPLSDSIEISRRDSVSKCVSAAVIVDSVKEVNIKDSSPQLHKSSSDVRLIEDEVFDFDLPVSPDKSCGESEQAVKCKGDDDEVFFGPVGFTEKCVAAGVAEEAFQPLSPLRPDQIAELAKEAFSVAYRIANMPSKDRTSQPSPGKPPACHRRLASLFTQQSGNVSDNAAHSQPDDLTEIISPRKRPRSSTFTKDSPPLKVSNSTEKEHRRKGTFTKEEPVESLISACVSQPSEKEKTLDGGGTGQRSSQVTGRLQPPSKLRRFNNSQPNLTKPKVGGDTLDDAGKVRGEGTAGSVPPVARKSLQLPRPSGLPSARGSKLALPSNRPAAAPSVQSVSQTGEAPGPSVKKTCGIPKGPSTKPHLMQPGQLQRKTFTTRAKNTPSLPAGPMKPPQSVPKMGDTVERPYNPALAASHEGNSQCPTTPAPRRTALPKVLSVSSDPSTPAKSSGSSTSTCGSTPGSVSKRMSLLPMTKRRSVTGSLPPPSPLSVGSSGSSVSRRSLASSTDAADSPVFHPTSAQRQARHRRSSAAKESCTSSDLDGPAASPLAFKPRKALVQNTPELPKRTMSRWSPLRRNKPMPLEDQVSVCTKRVLPK